MLNRVLPRLLIIFPTLSPIVLEQQMKIFHIKFEQEAEHLTESKNEFLQFNEERLKEKESFQKTIHSLQKSLQDKVNLIKEKEESNSLLRKETMELVARYVFFLT